MEQRGAGKREVEETITDTEREPALRGKWQSRKTFAFESISPVNGKYYHCKTLEVIFAEEARAITVITVKVFYHN